MKTKLTRERNLPSQNEKNTLEDEPLGRCLKMPFACRPQNQ